MKVIHALIAPPGAGKTSWLIKRLTQLHDQFSVLAFPTKILASEVKRRLESINIEFNSINSDTVDGSVVQCLEDSLVNQIDRVIICTHESLRLINPDGLQGWHLYIDESPVTWDCNTCSFTNLSYRKVFDRIVDIVRVGDKDRVKAKESCKQLIEDLASGFDSTLSSDACKVLKALLDDRYIVEIDELDAKQNRTMRIIGVKHYIPAFEAAETTVIMGAEIQKTLLGVILKGAGWSIIPIEAILDFTGYGNEVIIHPFFQNKAYSKTAALMKGGKIHHVYEDDCLLDAWLKVDVFRIIGSRKAILVAHTWCQPELPIREGSEFSNISRIKIDNRGINDYDDYSIAICLQHGNITPIENRSTLTLAGLISIKNEIEVAEIKNAIKYERFYESTLQSVCRTALRSRSNNGTILLFVQDMDIANFLKERIGDCTIDCTYSELVVAPTSPAKTNREQLQKKAIELWGKGHNTMFIAAQIGKTDRTVRNWLKPYRQLEELSEDG
jgi:hypothetical protein